MSDPWTNDQLDVSIVYEADESKEWLLTRSPAPTVVILTTYVVLVLHVGPRWMANREPYTLRATMTLYNVLQVGYNLWMLFNVLSLKGAVGYHVKNACKPERVGEELRYSLYSWCFLVSKMIDLLDTVFLVLRKRPPTLLHIYHHLSMVAFTWISVRYIQAQQGAPPAVLNMFVHVVMYSYYVLTSLGPKVRPYLWWKSYLTTLQLGQFILIIMFLVFLHLNGCYVSRAFNLIWMVNVAVIAAFFINFYIQTYIRKPNGASFTELQKFK